MTTLGELARLIDGRLQGDPRLPISGASPLASVHAGEITLVDGPQRLATLEASPAAAAIAPRGVDVSCRPTIYVAEIHPAFARIVLHFRPPTADVFHGIHGGAFVSATAELADDVTVYPGASIGDGVKIGRGSVVHSGARVGAHTTIGCNSTIHPNAVLYEHTRIGDRVCVHAGAVLGGHGFGYEQRDGKHVPTAQLGWVEIGDDVEIGAATTIDRGTYGPTVIGAGTKIDNLVQIAHNCQIGRHNLICAQVGIAGSTTTGDYVVMAGQVGVRDHVHIGQGAILSAMAGITSNVPEGAVMMGIPATSEREQKLKMAALAKLPEMRKEFKAFQRLLGSLAGQIQASGQVPAAAKVPHVEGEAA